MAIIQFTDPGQPADTEEADAKFRRRLDAMKKDVDGALGNPTKLVCDVQKMMGAEEGLTFKGGLSALRRAIKSVKKIKGVVGTTASRVRELQNADAITALFSDTAVVEMAALARVTKFGSLDEAIATREEVVGLLQDAADASGNDETFLAYTGLCAAVVKDITTRAADLSRVETKKPTAFTNTIMMAYELYGDAKREKEIDERNGTAMPGFISPNGEVKVLNS